MNYIRGAFTAASQYYTSLPPINPSTLTGAIDVIVIERPVEDGKGETELVCSPFHVRFGKWQVLRPGEKKVKVFVNGLPIPFDMKIGEAGEAFFVVETDEEVPDDLLTSPILGPTKLGDELEPPTGRFGSRDVREDSHETESVPHKRNTKDSSEPPFLDLTSSDSRAQSPISSRTPSPIPSSPSSPGDRQFSTPPTSEESAPQTPSISPSSMAATPSSILSPNGMPSKASISAPIDEATKVYRSGDAVMEVTQPQLILGSGTPEPIFSPRISSEPQEGAEPVTPVYGHDVVLDMAGYHYARPMEQGDDAEGDRRRAGKADTRGSTPQKVRRNSESTLQYGDRLDRSSTTENAQSIRQQDVSAFPPPRHPLMGAITTSKSERTSPTLDHSEFPSSTSDDSVESERAPRANSEPPEVLLVTPSSSSPQEYAWTFPQPSLSHGKFLTEASPANSKPKDPETPSEVSPPPSRMPPSEAIFGSGGRLMPGENEHVFWVDIERRRFSFELSLCGPLEGTHEVNDAAKFENARIPYATFVDDPTMPDNENLVMRWNDVYISHRDSSPLMGALSPWRETAAQPTRPSSPSPLGASPNASSSQPTLVHSRGSSWALWWRSRSERDLLTASNPPPLPSTATPPNHRPPPLVASTSQPIQTPPEVKTESASPPLKSYIPKASSTNSPDLKTHYAKTLRLTSEQLKELHLNKGSNTITFSLASSGVIACTARIFVWDSSDHIVVSDIDGTITKSDALGHVFTMIGRDWTHLGVAKLYTDIAKNGYKIIYLTSRAIGQADSTRDYLKGIKQSEHQLPEGPVIMSPDRLIVSLHREVIMRKPEVFKMACLRDIQRLFGHAASKGPFYAGFGNRITDALSYRSVNIPSSRIFTIDSTGDVKTELLQLAGYKSSYINMTFLVDQMFPPVNQKLAADFTDFNYWRAPIDEYELPNLDPPSPTLSASSDTYRLSRLRNFSLRGKSSSQSLADNNNKQQSDPSKGELAPQSNVRASSPLASPALSADDIEEREDLEKSRLSTGRLHRKYQLDTPRPLDNRLLEDPDFGKGASYHEDTHDEPEDYDESGSDGHQHHDPDGEETFDDDLLATGEMDRIPFL